MRDLTEPVDHGLVHKLVVEGQLKFLLALTLHRIHRISVVFSATNDHYLSLVHSVSSRVFYNFFSIDLTIGHPFLDIYS